MPDIKTNLEILREKIFAAAQRSGRKLADIKLVAVTKTVPSELIEQTIQAGITDIGENRVQEAQPKILSLREKYPHVTWHMVGHLQTNKVKQALELFDLIQSVDSERLAEEIGERAGVMAQAKAKDGIEVLVEVNTSGEASKFGLPLDEVEIFLQNITKSGKIKVQGLMTVGLLTDDPEKARPCFVKLRELSETITKLNLPNAEMKYLSMGMSDDFEVAITEGSNLVRIGRALFGQRS